MGDESEPETSAAILFLTRAETREKLLHLTTLFKVLLSFTSLSIVFLLLFLLNKFVMKLILLNIYFKRKLFTSRNCFNFTYAGVKFTESQDIKQ